MHRVPSLQWQTWLRLAFVPAGKDWRALSDYRVVDGMLADYGIVPERALRDNQLGVCEWSESAPLITGQRSPQQGKFSVADRSEEPTSELQSLMRNSSARYCLNKTKLDTAD